MILDFDKLFEKYNMKIKGVLHIGAHFGQEHHFYKRKNIKNIAYFEPLKTTFNVLQQNVGNDAMLFNIALGNETKDVEMFVESNNQGQSSSILEPVLHTSQYPGIIFDKRETVSMKKLEDIELDFDNFNLINIDVQGYELEVFKGAKKILDKIDYIFAEINRDELYKNCAKIDELKNFLSEFGFILKEEDWAGGTWGDGLFIKKTLTNE
jgi:FkbM family methyltransferase